MAGNNDTDLPVRPTFWINTELKHIWVAWWKPEPRFFTLLHSEDLKCCQFGGRCNWSATFQSVCRIFPPKSWTPFRRSSCFWTVVVLAFGVILTLISHMRPAELQIVQLFWTLHDESLLQSWSHFSKMATNEKVHNWYLFSPVADNVSFCDLLKPQSLKININSFIWFSRLVDLIYSCLSLDVGMLFPYHVL